MTLQSHLEPATEQIPSTPHPPPRTLHPTPSPLRATSPTILIEKISPRATVFVLAKDIGAVGQDTPGGVRNVKGRWRPPRYISARFWKLVHQVKFTSVSISPEESVAIYS
eukprot:GHVU01166793.1.p2 GENE.GHVU01166793.1~~GHVU01166793.1.p2  ORF type:complete len:110 (-),score=4.53 GHVU01166793.1:528-857(-)